MHTEQLHEQYAVRIAADLDAGHSLTVEDRLADLGLTEAQIAGRRRALHIIARKLSGASISSWPDVIFRSQPMPEQSAPF